MVFPDFFNQKLMSDSENKKLIAASAFDRFFSVLLDYSIITPLVAFLIFPFFKYLLFIQSLILSAVLISLIQSLFIYRYSATPGQKILKLSIKYSDYKNNFLRIWCRQISFFISFLFLGLPFVSVLIHKDQKTWYDLMTDSQVISHKQGLQNQFFLQGLNVKQILLISNLRTIGIICIFFSLLIMLFKSNDYHIQKIKTPETSLKNNEFKIIKNLKCDTYDDKNLVSNLKKSLALNILNLTSNECVILSADQIFYDKKINSKGHTIDQAMAYFAKYYICTKTNDIRTAANYFKKACSEKNPTDLCKVTNLISTLPKESKRDVASVKNNDSEILGQNILRAISAENFHSFRNQEARQKK